MIPVIPYRSGDMPDQLKAILGRADDTWSTDVEEQVATILADVRASGDSVITQQTEKLHGVRLFPERFRIPAEKCTQALAELPEDLTSAIRNAAENVRRFHEHQKRTSWFVNDGDGVILGKKFMPVDSAAVYVPGGTAPLVSSLYMGVVPAKVAGVRRVVVCTPPDAEGNVDPAILAAAAITGADEVYAVAGVAGIGALAYGTETVQPVEVIVGPSNQYVQAAKKAVMGTVGIDMIAGPSEIVIIADDSANPAWVAADMLSQAEHGSGFEAAVAIVTDEVLAHGIAAEVEAQTKALSRSAAVERALTSYGAVFVVDDLDTACALSDSIAPEHLEVHTRDPWALLDQIHNAGAIFLGDASTEPVGDYYAGTNHVLPTGRAARFASSLGVDDFIKSSSIISYTHKRLASTVGDITRLAAAEGLTAHENAAAIRTKSDRT